MRGSEVIEATVCVTAGIHSSITSIPTLPHPPAPSHGPFPSKARWRLLIFQNLLLFSIRHHCHAFASSSTVC